jgi:hypothetical protein
VDVPQDADALNLFVAVSLFMGFPTLWLRLADDDVSELFVGSIFKGKL